MRIAIIQLSDMHCKAEDYNSTRKLEKAVLAIKKSTVIDKAVLVFSGDLVDTNSEQEYETGRHQIGKFLNDLGKELNGELIKTIIVPGNHDMHLPEDSRTAAEIEQWKLKDHLEDELGRQERFFIYANQKGCFKSDKICDVKFCDIGKIKIQFCLLNSAPYSTRTPDDKQFHYFPANVEEQLIRNDDVDLKITVMHHHFEWCEWDTKEMLKRAIKSDDITFFGHDHKEEMLTTVYADGTRYNIIMGGKLCLDYNKEASFNMVVYDSDQKVIERYVFNWSVDEGIFTFQKLESIPKKKVNLMPSKQYLNKLLQDKQNIAQYFTDYYVFPKLRAEGDAFSIDAESDSFSADEIFDALAKEKVVRITGGNGSGKSTLIRYLYSRSIEKGFIPLILEKRDYKDSNIEKMFKHLFEEQYDLDKPELYDKYVQSNDDRKIVFIDDVDLIKNSKAKKALISNILDSGKLLIYTTREKNQDLEEIVKDKLQGKIISTIDIMPFYKETRDELIERIGNLQHKNPEYINAVKLSLDYMVQSQTGLFTFTPDNAIQYIKFFMREGAQERKGAQTISMVFENNIRNSILQACSTESSANMNLLALEFLANYMYFELQIEKITVTDFEKLVGLYNQKKKRNLNAKQFLEACIKAKLLKQGDESFDISFYDKNTYAYFVAKALNTEFAKDPSNLQKISYVMNHICFGINDTIILFLSFITSNSNIILRIANEAMELVSQYEEWDIDSGNIPFLHETKDIPSTVPTKKEKENSHKYIENIEKDQHEMIQFRSIFDYNEEDVKKDQYVLLKALKYTQLIGRALIDQYGVLDDDEVDTLVMTLFTVPQKLIYGILKQTQDKIEIIVQDLLKFAKDNVPDEKIEELYIRQLLSQAGTMLALNIMNDIAFNAANEGTIEALRENNVTDNSNHNIMELMMEENVGNTDVFIERAIDLSKKMERKPYVRMLISQIARKHIVYTSSVDHRQINKLLSGKVLSEKSRPTLLISRGKEENR